MFKLAPWNGFVTMTTREVDQRGCDPLWRSWGCHWSDADVNRRGIMCVCVCVFFVRAGMYVWVRWWITSSRSWRERARRISRAATRSASSPSGESRSLWWTERSVQGQPRAETHTHIHTHNAANLQELDIKKTHTHTQTYTFAHFLDPAFHPAGVFFVWFF